MMENLQVIEQQEHSDQLDPLPSFGSIFETGLNQNTGYIVEISTSDVPTDSQAGLDIPGPSMGEMLANNITDEDKMTEIVQENHVLTQQDQTKSSDSEAFNYVRPHCKSAGARKLIDSEDEPDDGQNSIGSNDVDCQGCADKEKDLNDLENLLERQNEEIKELTRKYNSLKRKHDPLLSSKYKSLDAKLATIQKEHYSFKHAVKKVRTSLNNLVDSSSSDREEEDSDYDTVERKSTSSSVNKMRRCSSENDTPRRYRSIPKYDLTKKFIEDNCERILQRYKSSQWSKIVAFFFEKLFDWEIVVHCNACGQRSKQYEGTRPGLDENKKEAIYEILMMCGFRGKSKSNLNNTLNTMLSERRKKRKIVGDYNGQHDEEISRYNEEENVKANERTKKCRT